MRLESGYRILDGPTCVNFTGPVSHYQLTGLISVLQSEVDDTSFFFLGNLLLFFF